jgi:hypothetical protein
MIIDFYNAESIGIAKDILVMDIELIKLENWKSPPNRREKGDKENKTRQELDDIMLALTFIDENSSFNRLPRYSVDNLEDIPIMRMESGEFAILMTKLDNLEENLLNLKMSYANEGAARLQSSQQLARVSATVDQLSGQYAHAAGRSLTLPVHAADQSLGLSAARSSEPLTRHPPPPHTVTFVTPRTP